MAEDKSEEKKDETKKEEEVLTLAQVHDKTVIELENEETKEGDDDGAKDDKDAAGDDDKGDKSDAEADKGGDKADAGKDDKADVGASVPDKSVEDSPVPAEPAVELDTDTTKKGPGKIPVKDSDGATHYFNDFDEIPEDFEPATYKEWGRAVQKFTDKGQSDRKEVADAEVKKVENEQATRIQAIKDDWAKDEKSLVDQKLISDDPKERQVVVEAVHAVMNAKLEKGKVVDFETAFEIYSANKGKEDDKAVVDKKNDDKKKRAGMVAGSGSGASASKPTGQGRTIEAPPSGLSLDDIHNSVLGSL